MRRTALTLAAALLCCTACVRTQTITLRPHSMVPADTVPERIGTGDRVRIVVWDSVWGNRYQAGVAAEDLTELNRSLVFGSRSLSRLTKFFDLAETVLPPPPLAPPPPPAAGAEPGQNLIGGPATARDARELRRLLRERSLAHTAAVTATTTAGQRIRALAKWVAAHPETHAAVAYTFDEEAQALANGLARDPVAGDSRGLLLELASGDRDPIDRETLHATLLEARRFKASLDALLPFAPAGVESDAAAFDTAAQLVGKVLGAAAARRAALTKLASLNGETRALARRMGREGTLPRLATVPDPDPSQLLGDDLTPLFEPGGPDIPDPDLIRQTLLVVRRNTEQLAAAASQLPRWTLGPRSAVVLERRFEKPKEVTLTLVRHPRFGTFVVDEAQAEGGDDDDAKKKTAPASALGRLREEGNDTVARVRFEVFQRYRFHLSAGAVYSPLRRGTFEAREDTVDGVPGFRVRQTELARASVFPAALLSYSVYPFDGRIFAGQALREHPDLEQVGLSLQAGVSMINPEKDAFVGLSVEPIPGLSFGGGLHFARVERSRFPLGEFHPDSEGPGTGKSWRRRGAFNLSVDTSVFFETIAGLLQ